MEFSGEVARSPDSDESPATRSVPMEYRSSPNSDEAAMSGVPSHDEAPTRSVAISDHVAYDSTESTPDYEDAATRSVLVEFRSTEYRPSSDDATTRSVPMNSRSTESQPDSDEAPTRSVSISDNGAPATDYSDAVDNCRLPGSASTGRVPISGHGVTAMDCSDEGEVARSSEVPPNSDENPTRSVQMDSMSCESFPNSDDVPTSSVPISGHGAAAMDCSDEGEDSRPPESPPDSDDASTTTTNSSVLFSGEDSRSSVETLTASSSGSSGEIFAAEVRPVVELGFAAPVSVSGEGEVVAVRERCVGRQERVSWGFTSVIGRRPEMEDAVAVVPGFMRCTCCHVGGCTAPGTRSADVEGPVHFFGVYDGHGGSEVARYCAEKMHEVIAEEWNHERIVGYEWQKKWKEAFSSGFKRADDQVITEAVASEMVGSTAVVAVVSSCQIILSNCGDSRAVLCRRTQTIPLTVDHKPDRADELSRIEGEGGKVINWKGARVFGVLAMSRAIGDRYMSPYIIPVPEVTFMTRSDEDECLILASDGLWDVLSNDEVGEVARRLLRRSRRAPATTGGISPAQVVANKLTQLAIKGCSSDNISIIVIDLKSRRQHQVTE